MKVEMVSKTLDWISNTDAAQRMAEAFQKEAEKLIQYSLEDARPDVDLKDDGQIDIVVSDRDSTDWLLTFPLEPLLERIITNVKEDADTAAAAIKAAAALEGYARRLRSACCADQQEPPA